MEMCYKEIMDFYEFSINVIKYFGLSGIKSFWINFLDFTIMLLILK